MSTAAPTHGYIRSSRFDGASDVEIANALDVPRVALFEEVGSTLDVAHGMAAAGAPAGTLVLSDLQTAGRVRQGRLRISGAGKGIWLTLRERPADPDALGVLSLRLGLALAAALDAWAGEAVRVKWPNDLYVTAGKLAGILVEARWREQRLDWVAMGVGINVVAPAGVHAAGLPRMERGTSRVDVLRAIVPAMRAAARRTGTLDVLELERWAARDLAAGRACTAPVPGEVRGIAADGALLVQTATALEQLRSGSLVLTESGEESC